jgi:uncharacterized membrane protein YphA (DoxX/SURF4 family)
MMRYLKIISRIILGILFVFSGFVKAVDPLGSAYKFHDYFHAFNFGFLDWFTLPLAILLCTAEFIAGVSLISGIRIRTGIWVAGLLMLLFTPLTFILALTNPVSDCGCFGDAVKLTNWQTFGKNIILIIPAIFLFSSRKTIDPVFSKLREWTIIFIFSIIFMLFSFYNLRYLPVIDFLPYKTGVKIADKMIIPEGAESDIYNTTFIYEKDGITKEFTLADYPANDSTWKFIDQKSKLIKKGYVPPIHDFVISSVKDGEDMTNKILNNQGYTLLMISKKLSESDKENLAAGFETGTYCTEKGIDFYIVTASGSEETINYSNGQTFCTADETTLKTIIRANPGYVLLKNGVIIEKWSWANLPDKKWFETNIFGKNGN